MRFRLIQTSLALFLFVLVATELTAQKINLPRTIITTDGEVDDQDSFIRLLLYSNEMNIEGLIYSSSMWHYKGDGRGTEFISEMDYTRKAYGERTDLRWPGTTWMQDMIKAYAAVFPNLRSHASNFPLPEYLNSKIKIGNITFEGEMNEDTEGSDFIKQILLDKNPEPVYIQIWGGTNTVARALKSIEDNYKHTPEWNQIKTAVSKKTILYAILDQDATYKKYIEPNWPEIRVLYNAAQFWNFAYPWKQVVPEQMHHLLSGKWFDEHFRKNHGALAARYYLWGDGRQIENDPEHYHGDTTQLKKYGMGLYDFISEGDSPAFFHLINTGLGNLEHPEYGGWGGRLVKSVNPFRWEDGELVMDLNPFTGKPDKAWPQTRWIEVLQNDLAARADWCVKTYSEANHPPVIENQSPVYVNAKKGSQISLTAKASDPDKDNLNFNWWQYSEAGTSATQLKIIEPGQQTTRALIPEDAKSGETIHAILSVTDDAVPPLTRYQRVVIQVK
jgi:hypothetical protein